MDARKKRRIIRQVRGWTIITVALILIVAILWGIIALASNLISSLFRSGGDVKYDMPAPYVESGELVEFTGRVEHIFFHPLIAYPELTFDDDYMSRGFDEWFVTVDEFNKIMQSLYERDFILVHAHDLFDESSGTFKRKKLMLPKGKKPIIISLDDMNYYTYMQENGTVHRLVLDSNNNVASYTKHPDGRETIDRDRCVVPLLDDFVSRHPDFSHNGAKACIGLTGFEGILGYRTHADSPNRQQEAEAVAPIINRLKATGWTFASHSYSHGDTAALSYDELLDDCTKWRNEVESLVGSTPIYLYPYGSAVPADDPKYSLLTSYGFKAMCAVGVESYIVYHDNSLAMDRRHVDGIAFRFQRDLNLDLYDANEILDPVRPAEYQYPED